MQADRWRRLGWPVYDHDPELLGVPAADGTRDALRIWSYLRNEVGHVGGPLCWISDALREFNGVYTRSGGFVMLNTLHCLLAIGATGLVLLSFLSFVCGLVLDSVARGRKEVKRLTYLAIPAVAAPR